MRETTVATSLVIDLLGYLAARGFSEANVCAGARIERAALEPDGRVSGAAMERLWQLGESLTADPDLGLHAAEAAKPGALSILGYVMSNCRDLADVVDKLGRYAVILNDGLRVNVTREGPDTVCAIEAIEGSNNYLLRTPRQAMETIAAGLVGALSALANERIVPREISFKHAAPASTVEHQRILGVVVKFERPVDRIVFRTADLARSIRTYSPALLAVFERHAEDMLAHLSSFGPVGRRLLEVLAKKLQGEAPPLGEIASAMAMSARNLQRVLSEEGTSYQAVLDHARRELAERHLATPQGSAAEVAFLLGFADASAFTRAFRRWTGTTPGAWRRERLALAT